MIIEAPLFAMGTHNEIVGIGKEGIIIDVYIIII
jgi:hypothetical protein